MDRLLRRIRESLSGTPKRPYPPLPEPAPCPEDLPERFARALQKAGGTFVSLSGEEEAARWVAARGVGGEPGVDRADLLIADTGTVVRTYPSREASRVSLEPEVSVVLATPDRIVADLPEALRRLGPHHREGRAYTVLITGPSRTADIEKEPVVPAHGPRELIVVLLPER